MSRYKQRVFFLLKEHQFIQQMLINNLLDKHCMAHDLAKTIETEIAVIHRVQNGDATLRQQTLDKLIDLFYQLNE